MRRSLVALRLLLVCFITVAASCSGNPRTYPAGGTVRFKNGEQLKGGRIELRSVDLPYSARGAVDGEGRFKLTTFTEHDGAIAGKHQVIVTPLLVLHTESPRQHASHAQKIDSRLSRYATTWLEIEINPDGDNESILIELE